MCLIGKSACETGTKISTIYVHRIRFEKFNDDIRYFRDNTKTIKKNIKEQPIALFRNAQLFENIGTTLLTY